MTRPHLNEFELDLLAATPAAAGDDVGASDAQAIPHVAQCSACQARIKARRIANMQIRQLPRFRQVRATLQTITPAPSRRRYWPALALSAACAAAAVLALLPTTRQITSPPQTRVKGIAQLMAVALDGQPKVIFSPGDEVVLVAKAADYSHAVVLGVDAEGRVSQVWPSTPSQSGAIPRSGALSPAFRVTPGDIALHAVLENGPIDVSRAIRRAEAALAACPGRELDPNCTGIKLELDPGQATVNYLLQVQ